MAIGVLNRTEAGPAAEAAPPQRGDPGPQAPLDVPEEERPVRLATTTLAVALSCAAAAWMVGGVFRGLLPRGIAVLGVLLGVGLFIASHSLRRVWIQYLVLPLAVIAGAALMLPFARGGTATVPALIVEAVRQGGLSQPPVPFDPGWRFILLVVFAMLSAWAASLAMGTNRPKLGVLVPVPLAGLAALLQPPDVEVVASVVAAVLVIAALGVAQGAELSRQGDTTMGFEVRRLLRAAAMIGGLLALLVVLSRTGLLFPQPNRDRTIPPQRPMLPPPVPDQPLFTVTTPVSVPFRLGVIDTYDARQNAWLLPPFDTSRYRKLRSPARLSSAPPSSPKTFEAHFTIREATGHELPTIAEAVTVKDLGPEVGDDPGATPCGCSRTASRGLQYSVVASQPPSAKDLSDALPPASEYKPFLDAPVPPKGVQKLLLDAPQNRFDRLQYVRNALYANVIAAGVGKPVDLPPSRVDDMLSGKEASPYEITAGEALLARWAGVPSRIGYGYFGGTRLKDGSFELRPKNGATWLEVYFTGYGWVPIVGTPPRAKPSSNTQEKNANPAITASHNLDLLVYVPTRNQSILQYYEYVRYYVLVALPFVAGLVALLFFYPGAVKLLRRRRRRTWAKTRGNRARLAVAYGEFRDVCRDLNVGSASVTPLEFLRALEPDPQHQELAWLVTRAWWGMSPATSGRPTPSRPRTSPAP